MHMHSNSSLELQNELKLQVCLFSYIEQILFVPKNNIPNCVAALFTLYCFAVANSLLTIGLVNFRFRVMWHGQQLILSSAYMASHFPCAASVLSLIDATS
jgi:hypothetical protein